MRRHRRADGQQFFAKHEAREIAAARAAVLDGQRQAQPALPRQRAAEFGVMPHPGARPPIRRHFPQRLVQEGAHGRTQGLVVRGNGGELQRLDDRAQDGSHTCGGTAPRTRAGS
ncbi:Uncharacterised protein [Bordetella pertussis]|nr:Uncharacterised protein [Bordetella pertussis]